MAVKQFKFVSPGVFVDEIDNSQLPALPRNIGPVIIGRTERGPGMMPVKVNSFSEFIEMFGNPVPGGAGGDVWRDGNKTAPMYGAYAAQAWLKNNAPVTFIRLLGAEHTDATTAGKAGWQTEDSAGAFNGIESTDAGGGAYGLFLCDSASAATAVTGALAAIFYINEGAIALSGTLRASAAAATGTAVMVSSVGADKEFKAIVYDESGNTLKTTTFNFNENSQKYIRKVFNTNPTLTNSTITSTANLEKYWLGETFERHVNRFLNSSSAGSVYGVLLGLKGNAATKEGADFKKGFTSAQTGWFLSQDLQVVTGSSNGFNPENMTKLFRFVGLQTTEWASKNLKISIQDIKPSTNLATSYGTFTVVVRKTDDHDGAIRIVERFSNCTLDPASENYIAKKIGDMYQTWDDTERRYIAYGAYPNRSNFIRVEMNADVDNAATNPELLPFGCFGPVRHKGFAIHSGAAAPQNFTSTAAFAAAHAKGGEAPIARANVNASEFVNVGQLAFTASYLFPEIPLRTSSSQGDLANPKEAYFGIDTTQGGVSRFETSYKDMVRSLPAGYDVFTPTAGETDYSWVFTLDDLSGSTTAATYTSGSRAAGTSLTAVNASYRYVLNQGYDRFTVPLFGGFDGLDVTEAEPFRNTYLSNGTQTTNYAWNSMKRAIDTVGDAEVVEMNVLAVPGLTNTSLTRQMLTIAEDRGDTLAVIDTEGGYVPSTENTSTEANRLGSVDTTIDNLKARGLNTSYGATYYPWLRYQDTISGVSFWGPPSIAALGAFSYTEKKDDLWFAPAGFKRGGLNDGAAGIPVLGARERLRQKDRDKLYDANINPIGSFPQQGIVILGQKTLQTTPSALDRVNVRRLLIYVKREISRMASQVLFQPNVRVTWNAFISMAEPFLDSVKIRLGLEDYKLVLDETTTTAELKDRNVMYAKIALKPARAIEFIALEFSITDSGASFDD